MNIKVTVELDEGIKYTVNRTLTTEHALIMTKGSLDREPRTLRNTGLADAVRIQAEQGAIVAIMKIINTLDEHGVLYQYTDESGMRQVMAIKDVNEFEELKKKVIEEGRE